MQQEGKIRIKAMCLFYKDGKVLVSKGFDKVKNENFYRVLGGSVNFFETGEAGVRREIQEELLSEVEN
jgi:NADH pyrophosphatase NudC (nudix superfamily)